MLHRPCLQVILLREMKFEPQLNTLTTSNIGYSGLPVEEILDDKEGEIWKPRRKTWFYYDDQELGKLEPHDPNKIQNVGNLTKTEHWFKG